MSIGGKTTRRGQPQRPPQAAPIIPSLPAPIMIPDVRVRPAVNPPPREEPTDPRAEGALLSLVAELRDELQRATQVIEAQQRQQQQQAPQPPAPKKTRSVFDSLRPRTKGGWAIGIATIVTALTAGITAIVTSVGGGEGLAQILHAPKLREQIEVLRQENDKRAAELTALKEAQRIDAKKDSKRWRFVGAALCKGAMVTAQGLDCDAVKWEPRPLPTKRGELPPPWRARDYQWPAPPPDEDH